MSRLPPFAHLTRQPPMAARKRVKRVVHGVTLVDDYAWLRARNWQAVIEDPKRVPPAIGTYLRRENAFAREAFRPLAGLQKELMAEMRGRMREDEAEPR